MFYFFICGIIFLKDIEKNKCGIVWVKVNCLFIILLYFSNFSFILLFYNSLNKSFKMLLG